MSPAASSGALPGARPVRAPRGAELTCRGWGQEAALRMLMNNLDPEVAENPDALVVYGGTGRAARSWAAFDAIVRELRALADDETLLVQSGKPVGVFRTHEWAPRVLIANSNLVGKWANWDTFRELERAGLTMYGQMTAGSWIYIGTQGILQGTYETFAELARQHFGGTLRGRVVLTAGLGGMGGAQPLAVTMNEGVAWRSRSTRTAPTRRHEIGYVDRLTASLDEALAWARRRGRRATAALDRAGRQRRGDRAGARPARRALRRRHRPDVAPTTRWPATCPAGISLDEAARPARRAQPDVYIGRSTRSMADHVRAMLAFQAAGVDRVRLRQQPAGAGPGRRRRRRVRLSRASCRPSSGRCSAKGRGPFRWAALSGDPADIAATDRAILELFPDDAGLRRWIAMAQEQGAVPGSAGAHLLAGLRRAGAGRAAFNELVAHRRAWRAPIVIGRDHLDAGSVASPNRETEAMRDGSDAIADWPLLNALVNTAAGATWVSIHHGGGTGIGYSQHAGMVVVADGTRARRAASSSGS